MGAEQSNTSLVFDEELVLKVFRRLDEGLNPDLELGQHLTDNTRFESFPVVAGALSYERKGKEPITLAIVQQYVRNQGDAWKVYQGELGRFFEDRLPMLSSEDGEYMSVDDQIGGMLPLVELLGQRTAEMHIALAKPTGSAAVNPEAFTAHYRRSLYQSLRNPAARVFQLLEKRVSKLDPEVRKGAQAVLKRKDELLAYYKRVLNTQLTGLRLRNHGDLHLGQVLFTGKDWVIIDFEGEPARAMSERRIKRSALRDVAGMIRSFDYAVEAALLHQVKTGGVEPESEYHERLRSDGDRWRDLVVERFEEAYFDRAKNADFLPDNEPERRLLLEVFELDKAVYELGYELNNRPHMVHIPVTGILRHLDRETEQA